MGKTAPKSTRKPKASPRATTPRKRPPARVVRPRPPVKRRPTTPVVAPPPPTEPTHWQLVEPEPVHTVPPPPSAPSGRRIEGVMLASGRGILGIALLVVLAGFFLLLSLSGVLVLLGVELPEVELTLAAVWENVVLQLLFFLLLPLAYVTLVRPGVPAYRSLGLLADARTPIHLAIGLGAAIGLFFGLAGILYGLEAAGLFDEPTSDLIGQIGRLVRAHPELALVLPLAAGITEEVCFRGLLQPRIGFVGSNIVFGLTHAAYGTTLQIVLPFLVGFFFGWLYLRTGRLWAPIAAHVGFDLIQFVLMLVVPPAESTPAIGFF